MIVSTYYESTIYFTSWSENSGENGIDKIFSKHLSALGVSPELFHML